ncbi:hypothetical protein L6164_007321 [Bauhinia variegata]|uniref:Uncharacterized protein n=1 Tax=Bauhinia variegata TaxID=167791 RepID=A0ACB9PD52_BAUVA|nr:hypothetical protein L6164_007321 [Bauhinia variegata]
MRNIVNELALAQHSVTEEDLVVYILTQLGNELSPLIAAIKVRDSPISYSELFDKLTDFERTLHDKEAAAQPALATVHATQNQFHRPLPSKRISCCYTQCTTSLSSKAQQRRPSKSVAVSFIFPKAETAAASSIQFTMAATKSQFLMLFVLALVLFSPPVTVVGQHIPCVYSGTCKVNEDCEKPCEKVGIVGGHNICVPKEDPSKGNQCCCRKAE